MTKESLTALLLIMNNYLTYTAAAKILRLMNRDDCESMSIHIVNNHVHIEKIEGQPPLQYILINTFPKVFTSIKSLVYFKNNIIDFDYNTDSFVISL